MIEIAIKLQAWKNSMELNRTLKTLQDSLDSVSNPSHDSAVSVKRITNWQAHWQIANVLHFCRNVYFLLSLKQLRSIRIFKRIPAKSRAAISIVYIKLIVDQAKLVWGLGVKCVLLINFSAQSSNIKSPKQKIKYITDIFRVLIWLIKFNCEHDNEIFLASLKTVKSLTFHQKYHSGKCFAQRAIPSWNQEYKSTFIACVRSPKLNDNEAKIIAGEP